MRLLAVALALPALALVALGVVALLAPHPASEIPSGSEPGGEGAFAGRLSVGRAMAPGSPEGFARAIEPRIFDFPTDHGPHPEYRTEWWYLTGHLSAPGDSAPEDGGRRFGYQLTFFRSGLRPPSSSPPPSSSQAGASSEGSAWRADQIFMAHFALTDVAEERFHSFERFSRGALGLAGARSEPFRVWLDDWELRALSAESLFPLRLEAAEADVAIELTVDAGRPVTLHGDRGLSRKGSSPGNASYYYSLTRLPTYGLVRADGRSFELEGSSWMDREWSTSALEPGVVGWDWFGLELSDGRDVVLYRLRRTDGTITPESDGSIVEPRGDQRRLDAAEVDLTATGRWISPATGSVYPSGWRLVSSRGELDLRIVPLVEAQEHTGTLVYWEGAVSVDGTSGGASVTGRGYVELTEYGPRSQNGSGATGID